jgi:hypothetical protein
MIAGKRSRPLCLGVADVAARGARIFSHLSGTKSALKFRNDATVLTAPTIRSFSNKCPISDLHSVDIASAQIDHGTSPKG